MLDTPPALTIRRSFPRPSREAIAALDGALTGHVADALGGLGRARCGDQAAGGCAGFDAGAWSGRRSRA